MLDVYTPIQPVTQIKNQANMHQNKPIHPIGFFMFMLNPNVKKHGHQLDSVVNTCVGLFKKAMDAIASGGYANENDVIDGDGFVHTNLMNNLKLADATIKSMFNVTLIKTNKQNNERKSYGLDSYEEPNSGGDLAKKALSQTGMGNHYERIRLGKPDEKTLLRGRLKGAI